MSEPVFEIRLVFKDEPTTKEMHYIFKHLEDFIIAYAEVLDDIEQYIGNTYCFFIQCHDVNLVDVIQEFVEKLGGMSSIRAV